MANLNEIKKRIAGVRSTHQVTHAMYLISASKSKRAKAQLESVRPFFDEVESTLADVLSAHGAAMVESVFTKRGASGKRTLCLAIGGDKGMAGGYNHNLLKFLAENIDKSNTTVLMAGALARGKAAQEGFTIEPDFRFPVMNPNLMRARDISDILLEKYLGGEFGDVCIVYTRMVTALKLVPVLLPLLPLTPEHFAGTAGAAGVSGASGAPGAADTGGSADGTRGGTGANPGRYNAFHFEPDPGEVFGSLTPHYVKGVVYAALVDAYTSEQNARMIAMEGATKSADEIVAKLTLQYNHVRQAVITQGITEIVGGIPE